MGDENGKGDIVRPYDVKKYWKHYDKIKWPGKRKPPQSKEAEHGV